MDNSDERAKKAKSVLRLGVAMPIADVGHNEQVSEDYVRGVWDGWRLHLEDLEAQKILARGYADEMRESEKVAGELGLAGPGAAHARMAEAIRLLREAMSAREEKALELLAGLVDCARDGVFGDLFFREDCDVTCKEPETMCSICEAEAFLREPVPPRTGATEKVRT